MNPYQLNQISFFQFDNLVQNRVPFLLLNMGPKLADLYTSIYKTHLETYEVLTSFNEALSHLSKQNIQKDHAILLVCENGQNSQQVLETLEKNGYTNVYVINGGYQQMMTERASN